MAEMRFTYWRAKAADFAGRRLREIGGVLLLAVLAALAAALISYTPDDPSSNTSAPAASANWLGLPGAQTADWLVQLMGAGAWMALLIAAAWAVRRILHRGLSYPRLRVLAGFWALASLPLALALFLPSQAGAPQSGGSIGQRAADGVQMAAHALTGAPLDEQVQLALAAVAGLTGLAAGLAAATAGRAPHPVSACLASE